MKAGILGNNTGSKPEPIVLLVDDDPFTLEIFGEALQDFDIPHHTCDPSSFQKAIGDKLIGVAVLDLCSGVGTGNISADLNANLKFLADTAKAASVPLPAVILHSGLGNLLDLTNKAQQDNPDFPCIVPIKKPAGLAQLNGFFQTHLKRWREEATSQPSQVSVTSSEEPPVTLTFVLEKFASFNRNSSPESQEAFLNALLNMRPKQAAQPLNPILAGNDANVHRSISCSGAAGKAACGRVAFCPEEIAMLARDKDTPVIYVTEKATHSSDVAAYLGLKNFSVVVVGPSDGHFLAVAESYGLSALAIDSASARNQGLLLEKNFPVKSTPVGAEEKQLLGHCALPIENDPSFSVSERQKQKSLQRERRLSLNGKPFLESGDWATLDTENCVLIAGHTTVAQPAAPEHYADFLACCKEIANSNGAKLSFPARLNQPNEMRQEIEEVGLVATEHFFSGWHNRSLLLNALADPSGDNLESLQKRTSDHVKALFSGNMPRAVTFRLFDVKAEEAEEFRNLLNQPADFPAETLRGFGLAHTEAGTAVLVAIVKGVFEAMESLDPEKKTTVTLMVPRVQNNADLNRFKDIVQRANAKTAFTPGLALETQTGIDNAHSLVNRCSMAFGKTTVNVLIGMGDLMEEALGFARNDYSRIEEWMDNNRGQGNPFQTGSEILFKGLRKVVEALGSMPQVDITVAGGQTTNLPFLNKLQQMGISKACVTATKLPETQAAFWVESVQRSMRKCAKIEESCVLKL